MARIDYKLRAYDLSTVVLSANPYRHPDSDEQDRDLKTTADSSTSGVKQLLRGGCSIRALSAASYPTNVMLASELAT